jgi:membrane peptidoglycan carboxypeptidase
MEYFVGSLWKDGEGGKTFFMLPEMARDLQIAGYKTKEAVYEWLYKKSFMTVREYRTHQAPDVWTNAWKAIEATSGKPWKELDEDYMVPAVADPFDNCIIVTGGGEEMALWSGGRQRSPDSAFSIDYWR